MLDLERVVRAGHLERVEREAEAVNSLRFDEPAGPAPKPAVPRGAGSIGGSGGGVVPVGEVVVIGA